MQTDLPSLRALHLKVRIRGMNAGSINCLLQIIDELREAAERGCDVRATWLYEAATSAPDLAEEFRGGCLFPLRSGAG
jgi:hypothetical protein